MTPKNFGKWPGPFLKGQKETPGVQCIIRLALCDPWGADEELIPLVRVVLFGSKALTWGLLVG